MQRDNCQSVWCQKPPTCSNELGSSESLPPKEAFNSLHIIIRTNPNSGGSIKHIIFRKNIDNSAIKRYSIYYSISLNGV